MNKSTLLWQIVVLVVVGVGAYYLGRLQTYVSWQGYKPAVVINKEALNMGSTRQVDFSKFWEVWDKVSTKYVDKESIDPKVMLDGAISGMVSSLGDPYTVYLNSKQNGQDKESLNGTFEGVGIQLGYKDKQLVVVSPLDGTPAKRAGVKAGDFIVRIMDSQKKLDKSTAGITLPEAISFIRGPKGSKVKLELVRSGVAEPIEVELERDTILVKSVELEMVGDVAWMKLARFGERTKQEWDDVVSNVVNSCQLAVGSSGSCKGIVLDLRNNPGGYLESSVYIASEFLPKGKLVVVQQFGDGTKTENRVVREGRLVDVPLVVIVNEGSASAAEILAGAIADHKRAKVVGVRSFGKGSVQQPEDFADGSGLHTTIAKWLTPNGVWIDKNGVVPSIEVKVDVDTEVNSPDEDMQLQKAIEIL